ncbi:Short-chain dehydrogenase reductase [Hyphodiscus hymeniophilus]|uniref:Short-chain dehydrogenase reductase n=1 Tax=Hyphodiscus hymeniophilus TaxID=353542 RepID=A0A9P6VKX1_9HELO|nr:Short-chain dehydrogenase reductase [Hyphodiscus hymeniophilus]
MEKPSSGQILPLVLDLANLPTIKGAVEELKTKVTKIEAVFFNAGVMTPPRGSKTVQNYELQWGTNVVGHFLLQKLLLPLLLSSAKSSEVRILWTSSDGHNMSPSPDGIFWDDINGDKTNLGSWSLYAQSKAGNVILAAETARRYGGENIISASLNPGHLKTDLQRHSDSIFMGLIEKALLYDARYGALTTLSAGLSNKLSKETNGCYFIPWGRVGMIAPHVLKGLENGSGTRLWEMLEKEVAQTCSVVEDILAYSALPAAQKAYADMNRTASINIQHIGTSLSSSSVRLSSETSPRLEDPGSSALLRHAHGYGYSNSDSLNSMGILTKVVTEIARTDIPTSHPTITSHVQSRIRAEYFGFVRRLPSREVCEVMYQLFFITANQIFVALDETIFREQLARWWDIAYDVLLKQGPETLPQELQCFPALIFQVIAVTLQFLPQLYDPRLDELKFGSQQSFTELSREYTDCGMELSKLLGRARTTFVGVQHSYMRSCWLVYTGDLMQAWNHSGETVRDAMAIGLHLEPEVPASSQPEALLDALWMNELRKRTWLNILVWDSSMALALGRPMFVNLKECTVTAPLDCEIPIDRLRRVPVARSEADRPTAITERLLRYKLSKRFYEIRELENEGPIPKDSEKVKELHQYALDFRKSLPCIFATTKPDTKWDADCTFIPIHRELLSYLVDAFLMALHRPYIFTREKSQLQVYQSSLGILDSQEKLFQTIRVSDKSFYMAVTFPTFDAAVILAVVLVSSPERYHESFSRPYQSLKNALDRLTFIGSIMTLAKVGADILQATLSRVVAAHERVGLSGDSHLFHTSTPPQIEDPRRGQSSASASLSPELEPWHFEATQSAMDWTMQNAGFPDFDFSNLEVPVPLKELLMDEEMAALSGVDPYDTSLWMSMQDQQGFQDISARQQPMMDTGENSLWNYLTGYPTTTENQFAQ